MSPVPKSAEDRLRETGHEALIRLSALIRIGRAYQTTNRLLLAHIESFAAALEPLLGQVGEAALVVLDTDFYLNGVRIPVKATSLRFHHEVRAEFVRRGIAGIQVRAGVTADEYAKFFALFLNAEGPLGNELYDGCLAQGLRNVLPAVHAATEDSLPSPGEARGDASAGTGSAAGGDAAAGVSPRGARSVVPKSYSLALHGARSLLTATALQGSVEMRHAKRVVQPLVDGALSGEPVLLGLSTLARHDDYVYAHAVNVCLVAVTMGHALGLDRGALADLGVAALLHDVGKGAVAGRVHHPLEGFDEQDRAAAQCHTVEGAKLITRSTTLNSTSFRAMRAALEHHLGANHSGYPKLDDMAPPGLLSLVVGTADCYVSLAAHRSERGRSVTPYEALGMMLGPLAPRFDPALLWALVQAVGFYPPGQLVELEDGAIGIVLAPNAADPARPHLRLTATPHGAPIPPEGAPEFRPLPEGKSVVRALRAEEYAKQMAA